MILLPLTPQQAATLDDALKIASIHGPDYLAERIKVIAGKLIAARAMHRMDSEEPK